MVSFNLLEVDEQYVRQIFKCIRDLLFVGSKEYLRNAILKLSYLSLSKK